jgi:hypothetical protein
MPPARTETVSVSKGKRETRNPANQTVTMQELRLGLNRAEALRLRYQNGYRHEGIMGVRIALGQLAAARERASAADRDMRRARAA